VRYRLQPEGPETGACSQTTTQSIHKRRLTSKIISTCGELGPAAKNPRYKTSCPPVFQICRQPSYPHTKAFNPLCSIHCLLTEAAKAPLVASSSLSARSMQDSLTLQCTSTFCRDNDDDDDKAAPSIRSTGSKPSFNKLRLSATYLALQGVHIRLDALQLRSQSQGRKQLLGFREGDV
jgi:hypothetical protein